MNKRRMPDWGEWAIIGFLFVANLAIYAAVGLTIVFALKWLVNA